MEGAGLGGYTGTYLAEAIEQGLGERTSAAEHLGWFLQHALSVHQGSSSCLYLELV